MRSMLMAVTALAGAAPLGAQTTSGLSRLDAEIRRLVDASGASVGVGIRHLESGQELYVDGDRAFLMGSTFKVAVAVQLLTLVDEGKEDLDRRVPLLAGDLFPSGSLLSERFRDSRDPGAEISLRRYLELMLILSDNAATDVVLRQVGGPAAVTARIGALGITGLRVDRTVMDIYRDYVGLAELPPVERRNLDTLLRLIGGQSAERMARAQRAYHASEKDRSTPRAMVALLTRIWRREALSAGSTDLLLSVMRRVETGSARIAARLPPGTPVASKTGTYGTVVANDVGVVDLPDGAGHLVVAVFTEDTAASTAAKDRLIADVARAAYDFFGVRAVSP